MKNTLTLIILLITQLATAQNYSQLKNWQSDYPINALTVDTANNLTYVSGIFNALATSKSEFVLFKNDTSQFDKLELGGNLNGYAPDGNGGFYLAVTAYEIHHGQDLDGLVHIDGSGKIISINNRFVGIKCIYRIDSFIVISHLESGTNKSIESIFDFKNDTTYEISNPLKPERYLAFDGKYLLAATFNKMLRLNIRTRRYESGSISTKGRMQKAIAHKGHFYCIGEYEGDFNRFYSFVRIDSSRFRVDSLFHLEGKANAIAAYGNKIIVGGENLRFRRKRGDSYGLIVLNDQSYNRIIPNSNFSSSVTALTQFNDLLWVSGSPLEYTTGKFSEPTYALDTGSLNFITNGPKTEQGAESIFISKNIFGLYKDYDFTKGGIQTGNKADFTIVENLDKQLKNLSDLDGGVTSMALTDSLIILSGYFNHSTPQNHKSIAILNRQTYAPYQVDVEFKDGNSREPAHNIFVIDSFIYYDGNFTEVNGVKLKSCVRQNIRTLDIDTNFKVSFNTRGGLNSIKDIGVINNEIIVAGRVYDDTEWGIIALDYNTGATIKKGNWVGFVNSAHITGDSIYIAGSFKEVNYNPGFNGAALLTYRNDTFNITNWHQTITNYNVEDYYGKGQNLVVRSGEELYHFNKATNLFKNLELPHLNIGLDFFTKSYANYENGWLVMCPETAKYGNGAILFNLIEDFIIKQVAYNTTICGNDSALVAFKKAPEPTEVSITSSNSQLISANDIDTFWNGRNLIIRLNPSAFNNDSVTVNVNFNIGDTGKIDMNFFLKTGVFPNLVKRNDSIVISNYDSSNIETVYWYRNDTLVDTNNSNSYKPNKPGTYAVVLVDKDGCSFVSGELVVSISDREAKHVALSIFPNPSSGLIHIKANRKIEIERIKVFSAEGKCVVNRSKHHLALDLSQLPDGIYSLIIQTKNGANYKYILNKI